MKRIIVLVLFVLLFYSFNMDRVYAVDSKDVLPPVSDAGYEIHDDVIIANDQEVSSVNYVLIGGIVVSVVILAVSIWKIKKEL